MIVRNIKILIALIILVLVTIICLLTGTIEVNLSILWSSINECTVSEELIILLKYRLPRVVLAGITGGGLALGGLVFQSLFRNPLATPFTIGLSSASSFGAVLAIKLGIAFTSSAFMVIPLFSFTIAVLTVMLLFVISKGFKVFLVNRLLLSGVAFSFLFSGLILYLLYSSGSNEYYQMLKWIIGGLDVIGYDLLLVLFPVFWFCTGIIYIYSCELNLISIDIEFAQSKGVSVKKVQRFLFFITVLLTASIISVTGPIGFIGIVIPHIARLIGGNNYRTLIPLSIITGATILIFCDTLARTILAPSQLPVGIITSILGSPFFLWLLVRDKRE